MALFALLGVLRGFPAAAYREVAFLSRFVCGNRKPLCGLDQDKICSFLDGNFLVKRGFFVCRIEF
jgi:hypothetical protein